MEKPPPRALEKALVATLLASPCPTSDLYNRDERPSSSTAATTFPAAYSAENGRTSLGQIRSNLAGRVFFWPTDALMTEVAGRGFVSKPGLTMPGVIPAKSSSMSWRARIG